MRVVVALHGNTILLGVDFKKAAPADLEMLAERHRDGPKQFVGIRGEPNAFAEIQQKQRVGFGLFAPCDIANGDVHAEQLAGFGVDRIVAANTSGGDLEGVPDGRLDFLVDDRLTGVDDAAIMNFNVIREIWHGFAHGFADVKIPAAGRSFPPVRC